MRSINILLTYLLTFDPTPLPLCEIWLATQKHWR